MKHKHLAFRFPAFAATVAVMTVAAVVAGCADGGSEESALAMRTEVGRQIFHDPNLSEPRGTSCASCHSATQGFSGLNGATNGVTRGPGGRAGLRSSMSTAYMSLVPPFEFRPRRRRDPRLWRVPLGRWRRPQPGRAVAQPPSWCRRS
jgi:cytochrome c peroxidase